uniref:MYND-type domain-containing protein n=1 Tax=Macrostomum lignano TaxID=282301 RepID=A0A1I8FGU9_9PLAT
RLCLQDQLDAAFAREAGARLSHCFLRPEQEKKEDEAALKLRHKTRFHVAYQCRQRSRSAALTRHSLNSLILARPEAHCRLNKQYIGHRYVRFPTWRDEAYIWPHGDACKPAAKRSSRKATPVVKLTGLPESAAAHAAVLQTLLSCCPGVRIAPDGLLLFSTVFQPIYGCAFVQAALARRIARCGAGHAGRRGRLCPRADASLSSSREAYHYSTGPFGEGGLDPNDLSDCCDIEDSDPIEESEPTSFGSISKETLTVAAARVRVRGLPGQPTTTDLAAEFFAPLKPCLATVASVGAIWSQLGHRHGLLLHGRGCSGCCAQLPQEAYGGAASSAAAAVQPMRSPWRLATLRRCRNKRYCSRACQQQHWPRHKQLCGELAAQLSWADFMQRLRLQISRLMDLPDSPMRQLMPDHVLAPFQYPCWPWLLFGSFQFGAPSYSHRPVAGTVPGIPVFMYSSLDEPPELSHQPAGNVESLLASAACPGQPVRAGERPARCAARFGQSIGLIFPKESPLLGLAYFYV